MRLKVPKGPKTWFGYTSLSVRAAPAASSPGNREIKIGTKNAVVPRGMRFHWISINYNLAYMKSVGWPLISMDLITFSLD